MIIYKNLILSLLYILTVLMLITGCFDLETEIDLKIASFPPKLCITANLDSSDSTFMIVISEGRALADYKQPRLPESENKRYGEIRLYEDDRQILLEAGEFDLRHLYAKEDIFSNLYDTDWNYNSMRYGHRFKTTVATKPGSVYRLEVKVDGYQTVTSTSTMPLLSQVSASIDTTVIVRKSSIKNYSSLNFNAYFSSNLHLWPVTLQWGARENGRNYYALDMYINRTFVEGDLSKSPYGYVGLQECGILVGELSKLHDNPEVEMYESQQIDFEGPSKGKDAYAFPILMMSDISFTNDYSTLTLYKDTTKSYYWVPDASDIVRMNIYNEVLTLRVRYITEVTFNYYRSLVQQSTGVDFFTEPYIITGNIENGYGGFTVCSAVNFQLLDYQVPYYYDY